jgi:CheY-like chemotaxis protein
MSLLSIEVLLLVLLAGTGGLVAGWLMCAWTIRRRDLAEAPRPAAPTARMARAAARARPGARGLAPTAVAPEVRQPRAAAPGQQPPVAAPAAPAPEPAADLLLVDDSAVARTKLRRLFEAAGYQVHLASDGVEALALLDKGDYRMLITDLEMPNMDGITLINNCLGRPQTARMPILAISGHESLRAKFNECRDIAGIHRKPWVDDLLLSHVATLVGTRASRAGRPPQASGQPA